jgi:hypothetical protein
MRSSGKPEVDTFRRCSCNGSGERGSDDEPHTDYTVPALLGRVQQRFCLAGVCGLAGAPKVPLLAVLPRRVEVDETI